MGPAAAGRSDRSECRSAARRAAEPAPRTEAARARPARRAAKPGAPGAGRPCRVQDLAYARPLTASAPTAQPRPVVPTFTFPSWNTQAAKYIAKLSLRPTYAGSEVAARG